MPIATASRRVGEPPSAATPRTARTSNTAAQIHMSASKIDP